MGQRHFDREGVSWRPRVRQKFMLKVLVLRILLFDFAEIIRAKNVRLNVSKVRTLSFYVQKIYLSYLLL